MDDQEYQSEIDRIIASYDGWSKFQRLLSLATRGEASQSPAALRALIAELKQSEMTEFYRKHVKSIESEYPDVFIPEGPALKEWMMLTDSRMRDLTAVAENELRSAVSSLIKESIRLAMADLSSIYLRWGRLDEALKELLRTRDHCSTPTQHTYLHMQLMVLSVHLGHFINTTNFVHKVLDLTQDTETQNKCKLASALIALSHGDLHETALRLLSVGDIGSSALLAASDVGLVAVLCGLASLDHSTLRRQLLDNKPFLARYVTDPRLKAMVSAMTQGHFAEFLADLQALKPKMRCDLYLASHTTAILQAITNQLVLHYLAPYSLLQISRVEEDLGLSRAVLLEILVPLIQAGKLPFRIDTAAGTLVRNKAAIRSTTKEVQALTAGHLSTANGCLLRWSLTEAGLFAEDDRPGPDRKFRRPEPYDREDQREPRMRPAGGGGGGGAAAGGQGHAAGQQVEYESGEDDDEDGMLVE